MPHPEPPTPRSGGRSTAEPGTLAAAEGARAAGLLAATVGDAPSPRLEMVRALALDIRRELEATARTAAAEITPDLLVEAALRCADLATLAACNAGPELTGAGAVARRAARAARELRSAAESGSPALEREHAENLLRDARGIGWRVDLACRQVEPEQG